MDEAKKNNSANLVRQARNAAEKQRRDKLNTFINDLANAVPFTPYANKRLDKISILRLSAAYLRLHLKYDFLSRGRAGKTVEKSKESHMMNKMIETANGFMLLLNDDRKIILVSHNCLHYLGHQNIDMIGNQFDAFIHPFEVDMIKEELDRLKSELNCSGSLKSRSTVLRCRMKTRIQPKMEYPNYQFVQISGYMVSLENELSTSGVQTGPTFDSARSRAHPYLRSANGKLRSTNLFNCTNKSHNSVDSYGSDLSFDSTRSSTTNGSMSNSPLGLGNRSLASKPYGQNSRPKYLFVGLVQSIQRDPFEQLTLFESLQDEYNTLFALDCKLLAVDHRISNIIGFLPKEIINSYAYEHIHKNDQLISKIAHQMMLDSADGTGKIVHRLRTKSGNYVYIMSIGRLNFDESRTPQNFTCYNRLLSDAEGEKERVKLMQKFSLQSLNPLQAGGQMSFGDDVSTDLNEEIHNGSNQSNGIHQRNGVNQSNVMHPGNLVESNLGPNPNIMDSKNGISLNALPPDSLDGSKKSPKLNDCLRLPSAKKVDSALEINNSFGGQSFGHHLPNQAHFVIDAGNPSVANFFKIDRNLLQHSPSVGLLIVNQVDSKLVQQTHSLSLTNKSTDLALSSHCPNNSNGSAFLNGLDRFVSYPGLSSLGLPGHIDNRILSSINGASHPTQLFIAKSQFHLTDIESPTNGSNGNPAASNHPNCEQYSQMSINQNAAQSANETNQSVSQVSSVQLNSENDSQSMNFSEHGLSGPFSIHPVKCY